MCYGFYKVGVSETCLVNCVIKCMPLMHLTLAYLAGMARVGVDLHSLMLHGHRESTRRDGRMRFEAMSGAKAQPLNCSCRQAQPLNCSRRQAHLVTGLTILSVAAIKEWDNATKLLWLRV